MRGKASPPLTHILFMQSEVHLLLLLLLPLSRGEIMFKIVLLYMSLRLSMCSEVLLPAYRAKQLHNLIVYA